MVRLWMTLVLVVSSLGANAHADTIPITRESPFDFVQTCTIGVPAPCPYSEGFSVSPGAYADQDGLLHGSAVVSGLRAWAATGIALAVPAGSRVEVSADVTVQGVNTFKACLDVGPQPAEPSTPKCAMNASGRFTLSNAFIVPEPGVPADPRVRLVPGEDCALACQGTAVAQVHSFTYKVL